MTAAPGLIDKSIGLARVLWLNFFWMRVGLIAAAVGWVAAYFVDAITGSIPYTAAVMAVPILLEIILALVIAVRASLLLVNSQLYLMGVRREIFINLLLMCLLFSIVVYDPKNAEHVVRAKLIAFDYLSLGVLWLLWVFSLQLLAMLGLVVLTATAIGIGYNTSFDIGALSLAFMLWGYFGCWLWKSPLQKTFKFDDFGGVADYLFERIKIGVLGRALRVVRCKEHVILLEEGDGYLNRLLISPAFGLLFIFGYVVFMPQYSELCLSLILLLFMGNRSKLKLPLTQKKLWLLSAGNREQQFALSEKLFLRLHLYSIINAGALLLLWIWINPSQLARGISTFILFQMLALTIDYVNGLFDALARRQFYLSIATMPLVALLVFMPLPPLIACVAAVVMLFVCLALRKKARERFLQADFRVASLAAARLP